MNEPLDQIDVMAREIEELRSCHDDLVAALEGFIGAWNGDLNNPVWRAGCAALKRAKEG